MRVQKVVSTPGSKMAKSMRLCKRTPRRAHSKAASTGVVFRISYFVFRAASGIVRSQKAMMNAAAEETYRVRIVYVMSPKSPVSWVRTKRGLISSSAAEIVSSRMVVSVLPVWLESAGEVWVS